MDDTVTILGFTVKIERDGTHFVMTSERLPGCIGQVDDKNRIIPEMERLIKRYLREVAGTKLKTRKPAAQSHVPERPNAATIRKK